MTRDYPSGDTPAGGLKQSVQAVAHRRAPAVTNVQGPGWIGGHEFHLDLAALAVIAAAEGLTLGQYALDDGLVTVFAEKKIDESRSGDFRARDQLGSGQGVADGLRQLPGRYAGSFRQGEGDITGQVTVALVASAVNLHPGLDVSGQLSLFDQRIQRLLDQPA